ncbi:FAD-dependent sensor of blue light [Mucilaginibacter gracilis]|uniref:FAD-dependent sensor of blue light n=1 Tax=Mucilaginibacter gracilis TaxID=423350 RepID=A0A495J4Y9_9SPHI|nr:BLUF domain-containing protein [Mucilaginibacter gracilis]RKR83468.1 FAD-dependent sensor of blue light [Mucilaginibacter gracilis]
MNYLTYISTSVKLFSDSDLKEMLEQSLINNTQAGITGLLLYNKGTFFQVLEGEAEQIKATFEKIKADPCHHNIIKMKEGKLAKRNFSDWRMGFTTPTAYNLTNAAGFVNTAKGDFIYQYQAKHPAIDLLKSFVMANNFAY